MTALTKKLSKDIAEVTTTDSLFLQRYIFSAISRGKYKGSCVNRPAGRKKKKEKGEDYHPPTFAGCEMNAISEGTLSVTLLRDVNNCRGP